MNEAQSFLNNDVTDFEAMHNNAAAAVRLLKSLANETRLKVMCVLAEGEVALCLTSRINGCGLEKHQGGGHLYGSNPIGCNLLHNAGRIGFDAFDNNPDGIVGVA